MRRSSPILDCGHEFAHVLGLGEHFAGFAGTEAVSLELLVKLTVLIRKPPGTNIDKFCVAR